MRRPRLVPRPRTPPRRPRLRTPGRGQRGQRPPSQAAVSRSRRTDPFANRGSPGAGVSSAAFSRWLMTRAGIADATPEVRTTVSASAKVVGSPTVGPDPMTDGSSATGPCTSEIAQVTDCPATAARRPPLMAERCFRTEFRSAIGTPAFINARAVLILSSSESPGAGTASSEDAPPDSRTTSAPPARVAAAPASARRPAASLAPFGDGCAASNHSRPGASAPSPRGPETTPARATPARSARQNARAMGHAALPAATMNIGVERWAVSPVREMAAVTRAPGSTASTAARRICSASFRRRSDGLERFGPPVSAVAVGPTSRTVR